MSCPLNAPTWFACSLFFYHVVVRRLVMVVGVVRVLLVDGLSADPKFAPPLVALGLLHVGFEIQD